VNRIKIILFVYWNALIYIAEHYSQTNSQFSYFLVPTRWRKTGSAAAVPAQGTMNANNRVSANKSE